MPGLGKRRCRRLYPPLAAASSLEAVAALHRELHSVELAAWLSVLRQYLQNAFRLALVLLIPQLSDILQPVISSIG